MPAGVGICIIELVANIPTEYAAATLTLFVHQLSELLQTHILAADYSIDVRQAKLNLPNP